jgi:hypothetical protein
MEKNFQDLVKQVITKHGTSLLDTPQKFKSILKDYAEGEFGGEIRTFTGMLSENYQGMLANTKTADMIAQRQLAYSD